MTTTVEDVNRRALERRAVEATIWGMPIVSMETMRQAFFRDAGAQYGDILFWSKPSDWKFQFTTPNASTRYVYFNFNLKDGPVVLDVPAAVGAGLFGSVVDAWQVPVTDVGPAGDDAGNGGKYVFVPPGYAAQLPQGYFPIQFQTFNGYSLLRAISTTSADADVAKALALVKQLRVYPLAQAANPPTQKYIDMAGKLLDGVVQFDETFFASLARMVNEEPVLPRDLATMGQLRSLGIEKGKDFKADSALTTVLRQAAASAHEGFMLAVRGGEPWFPNTHWNLVEDKGAKTGFSFQDDRALYVDERAAIFFLAFALPKKLGAATFYVVGANDADRRPARRSAHLPADGATERAGQAVLGDHRVRPGHRVSDSRSASSRSRLVRSADAAKRRWLGRHLLRSRSAGWPRGELDSDGRGKTVVHALSLLWPRQTSLREDLANDRHRARCRS